jgi:uncharacterized membrane protein YagU involved in acid resistance
MRKIWATVLGGAAAGFLDHMSALASLVPHGTSALSIHQYLASAVIGPTAAFAGGWATALFGLCVHFSLTTLMAGIFVVASQRFPALLRQPWLSGPAYGVLIYFVMNYVAVPLSAAPNWKLPQGWAIVGGLLAHCFYVGLPIAAIARAFLATLPAAVPTAAAQQQLGQLRRT